ncbi:fibrinogen C domain-containing protein 1 [Aplysia californica]|uniref:Fibrinogen C domain-containing protein 1 n=1 Tax=Aplysia californica TaxID=6500 RepID=A0ABM0JJN4_APLCA|nr:fibrinogen C domain-containing protein 1 [Aplysia californica]
MDANWVSLKLILAAALFLSSPALVLNVTIPEVEVGKTANVSLECSNPCIVEENKEEVFQQLSSLKRDLIENITEVLEESYERQLKNQLQVRQIMEENKNECENQKQDFLEKTTAIVEDRDGKLKKQMQDLKCSLEKNGKKDFQQRQILENFKTSLEDNKRECLQQKQDILENVTAAMKDLENKLSAIGSHLQPESCADVQGLGPRPVVSLRNYLKVVCDTVTDNGGWIVILRRASADVDFFRGWADYKNGFGNLRGNFWFGLEKIHQLTNQRKWELRIDMTYEGKDYYACYNDFVLRGESENYKIFISEFSGNVSDDMAFHNGMPFSTKDSEKNACASHWHGGWWYGSCHRVHLTGVWGSRVFSKGLNWKNLTGFYHSVSFSEMKIRPHA